MTKEKFLNIIREGAAEVATYLDENNLEQIYLYIGLKCAIECGATDIVDIFLQRNAHRDANGAELLLFAAECAAKTEVGPIILNNLVANGVDINAGGDYSACALVIAIEDGRQDIAKILLKVDAIDVNIIDDQRSSALCDASVKGWSDVVAALLTKGADIKQIGCDYEGFLRTPLAHAAYYKHKNVLEVFLSHKSLNIDWNDQLASDVTPLQCAIEERHKDIAILLLNAGLDVNKIKHEDYSTLRFLFYFDYEECLQLLFNYGLKITEQDYFYLNPELNKFEEKKGCDKKLSSLLKNSGVDVNFNWKYGITPLMFAAQEGNVQLLKDLLSRGANINDVNQWGNTALMMALCGAPKDIPEGGAQEVAPGGDQGIDHEAVMETLVGAAILDDALAGALAGDDDAMQLYFLIKNVNPANEEALINACSGGDVDLVKILLKSKVNINVEGSNDNTALMNACYSGKTEMVEILLSGEQEIYHQQCDGGKSGFTIKNQIDIDASDNDGVSSIMIAVKIKNLEILKLLEEHGADINAADHNGKTVLMMASEIGDCQAVKFLLDCGADIGATDEQNMTAQDYARGNDEMLKVFNDLNASNLSGEIFMMESNSLNFASDLCDSSLTLGRFFHKINWQSDEDEVSFRENGVYHNIFDEFGAVNEAAEGAQWASLAQGGVISPEQSNLLEISLMNSMDNNFSMNYDGF